MASIFFSFETFITAKIPCANQCFAKFFIGISQEKTCFNGGIIL